MHFLSGLTNNTLPKPRRRTRIRARSCGSESAFQLKLVSEVRADFFTLINTYIYISFISILNEYHVGQGALFSARSLCIFPVRTFTVMWMFSAWVLATLFHMLFFPYAEMTGQPMNSALLGFIFLAIKANDDKRTATKTKMINAAVKTRKNKPAIVWGSVILYQLDEMFHIPSWTRLHRVSVSCICICHFIAF